MSKIVIPTSVSIAPYRKAVVAVIGAITTIAAVVLGAVDDGSLDIDDVVAIVTVIGSATGVYAVANKPEEDVDA